MRAFRMVSNEEGEQIRIAETARQESIKSKIVGATVVDLTFSGVGISNHKISEAHLEKDGKRFCVSIEADLYYECIEKRLVISCDECEIED